MFVILLWHTQTYCFLYTAISCTIRYYTILYCTVLYCTVLYYAVLCLGVLCCAVMYCIGIYCTALYCTVLYCIVLYWLYCNALRCNILHCTALHVHSISEDCLICQLYYIIIVISVMRNLNLMDFDCTSFYFILFYFIYLLQFLF